MMEGKDISLIDLRKQSKENLYLLRTELLKALCVYRIRKGLKQLKELHLIKQIRKDIARINTLLGEKMREKASE